MLRAKDLFWSLWIVRILKAAPGSSGSVRHDYPQVLPLRQDGIHHRWLMMAAAAAVVAGVVGAGVFVAAAGWGKSVDAATPGVGL